MNRRQFIGSIPALVTMLSGVITLPLPKVDNPHTLIRLQKKQIQQMDFIKSLENFLRGFLFEQSSMETDYKIKNGIINLFDEGWGIDPDFVLQISIEGTLIIEFPDTPNNFEFLNLLNNQKE